MTRAIPAVMVLVCAWLIWGQVKPAVVALRDASATLGRAAQAANEKAAKAARAEQAKTQAAKKQKAADEKDRDRVCTTLPGVKHVRPGSDFNGAPVRKGATWALVDPEFGPEIPRYMTRAEAEQGAKADLARTRKSAYCTGS